MKKLILSLAAVAVFGFTSCSSDDDGGKSCEQLTQDVFAALEAYMENDTTANCNAYKAAMQASIDNDCPGSSAYAAAIADLDC